MKTKLQNNKKINYLVNTIATYDNKLILLATDSELNTFSLPEGNRSYKGKNDKLGLLEFPVEYASKSFKEQTGLIFSLDNILGNYHFNSSSDTNDNHFVVYGNVKNFTKEQASNNIILVEFDDIKKYAFKFNNKNHYKILEDCMNLPMKEKYLI